MLFIASCSMNSETITDRPTLLPKARLIVEVNNGKTLENYIDKGICKLLFSDIISYAGWSTMQHDLNMSKILIKNKISQNNGTHFFIYDKKIKTHDLILRDALFVYYTAFYCIDNENYSKSIRNTKIILKKLLYFNGYINDGINSKFKDAVYNFLVDEGIYNKFEDSSMGEIVLNKYFQKTLSEADERVN